MNPVLDTLCCDHANFAKVLNVIEQQAGAVAAGRAADVDVLAALSDDDWIRLDVCTSSLPHPLFDCEVDEPLERLHQVLLACDSKQRTIDALRSAAII